MQSTGTLRYPKWVNQKFLIIGDIQYRRKDDKSEWNKMIFNGSKWIPYNIAIPQLKEKSRLHQEAINHNQLVRRTGRY